MPGGCNQLCRRGPRYREQAVVKVEQDACLGKQGAGGLGLTPLRRRSPAALTLREGKTTSRFYHPSLKPRPLPVDFVPSLPASPPPSLSALFLSYHSSQTVGRSVDPSVRGLPCVQVLSIPQSSAATTAAATLSANNAALSLILRSLGVGLLAFRGCKKNPFCWPANLPPRSNPRFGYFSILRLSVFSWHGAGSDECK